MIIINIIIDYSTLFHNSHYIPILLMLDPAFLHHLLEILSAATSGGDYLVEMKSILLCIVMNDYAHFEYVHI